MPRGRNRNDRSGTETPPLGLGRALRVRRKDLGLTQQALADLAGCSARSIREIERGKQTVRLDKLTAVARALGLELVLAPRSVR